MPKVISQTVDIGRDAFGRHVTMTRYTRYDGIVTWKIESAPINQRDDGERMDGLSDDNVRHMIQALDVMRGQ